MTISPNWQALLLLSVPVSLYLTHKFQIFVLTADSYPRKSVGIVGVLAAFFLYFLISMITLFVTGMMLDSLAPYNLVGDNNMRENLMQIVDLLFTCIALIIFSRFYAKGTGVSIWGIAAKSRWFIFCKSVVLSVIAYPTIMIVVQLVHLCMSWFITFIPHEQLAIVQLKKSLSHPYLFWAIIAMVVTIVPMMEEILFRGFLQNYFVSLFGSRIGIAISSLIFAGFHFAVQQGYSNIELLAGLSLLSYGIGCSYVKEQSLLAPIGMHAGFNAVSVVFMIQQI